MDPDVLRQRWSDDFDRLLDIVAELRDGAPTAVRMVGLSNEYLTDGGLRAALGKNAPSVIASFNEVSCTAASGHGGQCIDLRPVLNGPDLKTPADGNTQESMDAVADSIAAVGLAELGVG